MNCRLCLQPKLLRNSHIIPEFMYQDMYDPKHRFFGLSSNSEKKEKVFQKGFREYLLCDMCEQQFSRYESYAAGVFYGDATYDRRREGSMVVLERLQYRSMKLFLLSLIWRMSLATEEPLKGMNLGPHQEKLRQLLITESPGDFLTYPCLVTAVMINGVHVPDMVVQPGLARVDGHHVWSFVAAGFVFSFFVSGRSPAAEIHGTFLKSDGTMCIAVREIQQIDFLYRYACEIGEAKRKRDASKRK